MQQPRPQANQPRRVRTVNTDRQLGVIRFSPCGRFLAGGGYDATVRRWDYTEAALNALPNLTGHRGWVQALAFHPDQRRLFTADSWGEVRVWNHTERQPNASRTIAAHDGWVRDLAVSADGRTLATCGRDRKVCLWSTQTGNKLHELTAHTDDVFAVAFHPNNQKLVSGDLRGNVYEWDVANGRRGRTFDARSLFGVQRLNDVGGARRLVFDAAGRSLAVAGGRPGTSGSVPTILLFDFAAARLQHTVSVGAATDGFVFDLAFHTAGYLIAVTSGTPGTGKFFLHRPGEQAPYFVSTAMPNCHSLAVHPSGQRLFVAATNAGSNGNGRPLRNGTYPGNTSPLHLWELPRATP
ncbi:MAG: WD40 repeat domain-containing protein [Planctomycetes bacterium]|nr:WD40 repeat domain-containing protein [Planctomycetota bacterium]